MATVGNFNGNGGWVWWQHDGGIDFCGDRGELILSETRLKWLERMVTEGNWFGRVYLQPTDKLLCTSTFVVLICMLAGWQASEGVIDIRRFMSELCVCIIMRYLPIQHAHTISSLLSPPFASSITCLLIRLLDLYQPFVSCSHFLSAGLYLFPTCLLLIMPMRLMSP